MNYSDDQEFEQEQKQKQKQKQLLAEARKQTLKEELKNLENLLMFYGKIRQVDLSMADFINEENGYLLETNQQLLRDAALYTKDIESGEDRLAHFHAREALLLWCQIYCQKILMKKYHKDFDTLDVVTFGSAKGVTQGFQSIRDAINEYFRLPEEERKAKFKTKGSSVKNYMTVCAQNAVKTEFRKKYKLVEIKQETAEQMKKDGKTVFETDGRFYIFPQKVPVMVRNEEGELYENPEMLETLSSQFLSNCTQKMLDDYDLKVFLQEILNSMIQNGSLSTDDQELLSRSFGFRNDPEKISDIERDWIKRGKIKEGEIYNRRNRILKKIKETITGHPKWLDFAAARKEGRSVFF